jgi:hypothetical protein
MLQVFHLDILKVDWNVAYFKVTHLSQSPAAAAWALCMSVGGAEGWSDVRQGVREAKGDGGRSTVPARHAGAVSGGDAGGNWRR